MQPIGDINHEVINTNNLVYDMCVVKDNIFVSDYFGDHSISRRNLTTNIEETIYESDLPILSMTSFHIDAQDYIIFYKTSARDQENGKIILFNVNTKTERIIADKLKRRAFITTDTRNKRIFVAKTDAYGPKHCYKYSCDFVSYFDILKECDMIKEHNLDTSLSNISMIIVEMMGLYHFKKTYLQRNQGASGLYYDSVRNRLYFGRLGESSPGDTGSLKYLDLNGKVGKYKTYIVSSKDIASPHGITGDTNGNIYVGGFDNRRTFGQQLRGIMMFKMGDEESLDGDDNKYIIKQGHHVICCHFNEYDGFIYFSTGRSTNFVARIKIKHLL